MNEVVWSLIGLLAATTFGNFYWMSAKMDALGNRLESRIDTFDARLTGRLDALTARMDTHLETHHG